jgi:hypothetical protein
MRWSLPCDLASPQGVRASCPHLLKNRLVAALYERRIPCVARSSDFSPATVTDRRYSSPQGVRALPKKRLVAALYERRIPCVARSSDLSPATVTDRRYSSPQGVRASCPHLRPGRNRNDTLALAHSRSMSRWARTPTLLEGHCQLLTLLFLFPEN